MPPVFGRDRELAIADGFLESAAERFGVFLIEGEAGIGKSTVWQEILRRAEAGGFLILACRPAETETKLALSALADLLEEAPVEAFAALPDPQRRALEVVLLRAEPSVPLERRTVAAAVRSLLVELSAERPLLVAIDDVQWLDASSASILAFALRRLTDTRMAWVLSLRLGATTRLAPEALVGPESLTRMVIGPLSFAALNHLLKDRLEQPPTRSLLVRIERATGGNPFYALEIARELERVGPPPAGTPIPAPDDLRMLVTERLRRLPRATREELVAAAALSDPTTSLLDEHALGPAEEAELVRIDRDGRITFSHPLFASAVYGSPSHTRRRRLHGRLAGLVADPEERARHLALATTDPDESIARKLVEGAALARSRGSWESAAELLEEARRLTPGDRPDQGRQRGIMAAEHHVHAGDRSRARTLLEEILAEPLSPSLRGDALRLLAEISIHGENFPEAHRLLAEALEYADAPRVRVAIELGLGYVNAYLGAWAVCLVHAQRALDQAEQIGEGALTAQALANCAMYEYLCGRGVDWDKVERSLALEDPHVVVPLQSRPTVVAAFLALYVGQHGEARERLAAVRDMADERGDDSDLAFVLLWISWLETRSGNLSAAASLVEEGASFATLTGSGSMHAWLLAQRALVSAHQGDIAGTRRDCLEAEALVSRYGNALASIWIAASLALLELSLGSPEAAWEACEPLTEALEKQGIGEPVPAFFLPDALEALIALGQLERAEALIDALEERGRELDRPWALATGGRCRGMLLAARGDVAGAAAALDQAVAVHDRLEMPFELARTLLVKGMIERRARKRARAKASFERALEVFGQVGAKLWAQRARQELGRIGIRRPPGDQLTSAELRVAELAARGLTNREVAAALFVSPKTVEATLARIYRKLGIASRAELGARMVEFPQG